MDDAGADAFAAGEATLEQLEAGARWMAARAPTRRERLEHLGMANLYVRRRLLGSCFAERP